MLELCDSIQINLDGQIDEKSADMAAVSIIESRNSIAGKLLLLLPSG